MRGEGNGWEGRGGGTTTLLGAGVGGNGLSGGKEGTEGEGSERGGGGGGDDFLGTRVTLTP